MILDLRIERMKGLTPWLTAFASPPRLSARLASGKTPAPISRAGPPPRRDREAPTMSARAIHLSRRRFLSALALGAGTGLLPRPAVVSAQTPKRGGRLVIGADVNPVGLDPALTTAFASVAIYEQMYSSLATLEYATNKVKPDLAESWKNVEPNVVEFKLRQGVKFHGGREVTAEDVKYTFDRLMDEKQAVPLRSYLGPGFSTQVVDKYTVRVKNSDVFAPIVSVLADRRPTAIVDREVVEKNGDLKNADAG